MHAVGQENAWALASVRCLLGDAYCIQPCEEGILQREIDMLLFTADTAILSSYPHIRKSINAIKSISQSKTHRLSPNSGSTTEGTLIYHQHFKCLQQSNSSNWCARLMHSHGCKCIFMLFKYQRRGFHEKEEAALPLSAITPRLQIHLSPWWPVLLHESLLIHFLRCPADGR